MAVLKESGDAFLRNESLCLPLFSLELKNAYFKTSLFSDDTKSFVCILPLELYYFNNKHNFYEPLIEKTSIHFSYSRDKNKN